jgi:hypothetical protein
MENLATSQTMKRHLTMIHVNSRAKPATTRFMDVILQQQLQIEPGIPEPGLASLAAYQDF